MKILVFANNDVGLYRFRKELLQKLVKEDNTVYISVPRDEFFDSIKELGCQVINTKINRRGLNPIEDLGLFINYLKLIRKIAPDVVLTYTIKPNIYGGIACRFLKVNYIVNITGLGTAIEEKSFLSKILLKLYKISLKDARQIFFQNKKNKDTFIDLNIVNHGKLIPGSGVNLLDNPLEEYPNEYNGIKLLYVGRIMKAKGIGELIDCIPIICDKYPFVTFDFVGEYEDSQYRSELEKLEKNKNVKVHGFQKNVHSFMRECHAIILPSYHEGLSNVLLEVASTGRPILTTNVAGCIETFDEGVSGYGCNARDSSDLFRIIEKFVLLPWDCKKQMGINAYKKIKAEYSRDIVVNAYIDEINKLKGELI